MRRGKEAAAYSGDDPGQTDYSGSASTDPADWCKSWKQNIFSGLLMRFPVLSEIP